MNCVGLILFLANDMINNDVEMNTYYFYFVFAASTYHKFI